jgi:molybdate transport system ATP-binding protein
VLRVEAHHRRGALTLDVELEVARGGCLALAGPSGAGKTSVLRIVAGLLRPDAGRVRFGDDPWLDTDRGVDRAPEDRRCGVVFQEYALFGHLSAWRNVAYGVRGVARAERRRRAHELLERFGLGGRGDARPGQLSGGERQRVALARALAPDPAVLLLDEPLAALDSRTRATASRELGEVLARLEIPALLVTHSFEEAALLGDRVAVLEAGSIVQEGSAAELASAPASTVVADFTGAVVLLGHARSSAGGLTRVALDGGGEVLATAAADGPVAVSVHPWEIALEPPGAGQTGSARNRLAVRVASVTELGARARIGLEAPQPLAAEISTEAVRALALGPGAAATATWKAAATRLIPR